MHELTKTVGLRDRNKLEKLARIRTAARDVFKSQGYDNATTREIALRAHIGFGTLFTYAKDKRDLLFLTMIDDLEEGLDHVQAAIDDTKSLMANFEAMFRALYEDMSREPDLSRVSLSAMYLYQDGAYVARFRGVQVRLRGLLTRVLVNAVERREIRATEDEAFAASVFFAVYQVEVRTWLAGETLNVTEGIASLARALRLIIAGLQPPA